MPTVLELLLPVHMGLRPDVDEWPSMKTYPIRDETGRSFAVEVDMAYCSLRKLAKVIETIEGVTEAKICKPFSGHGDVRAQFRYQGYDFAIVEPFGDNSRYWIGPVSETSTVDVSPIEEQLKSYVPSLIRRLIGDFIR